MFDIELFFHDGTNEKHRVPWWIQGGVFFMGFDGYQLMYPLTSIKKIIKAEIQETE